MATGAYDANGIWQYGEDDDIALFSDLLNLGTESTSDAFSVDRARITTLENSLESSFTFVASSSAARDSHWGVPANATERLALQNAGATTIRTDGGYVERYYALKTDGGSNPGGRTFSGWRREPAGRVIQTVYGWSNTPVTNSTTTFATTGVTVTLTPQEANSFFLITAHLNGLYKTADNVTNAVQARVYATIGGSAWSTWTITGGVGYTATALRNSMSASGQFYTGSNGSVSPVTFTIQFANIVGASLVGTQANSEISSITVMEISGT